MKWINHRNTGLDKYDDLLCKLKRCKDKVQEMEILKQLDRLEDEIEQYLEMQAFASFGKDEQEQMRRCSQYRDEFVIGKAGTVRTYYVHQKQICGTEPKCGTLMASKAWARKHEEHGEKGQV